MLDDWKPPSRAMSTATAATTLAEFVVALDELRHEMGLSYARLGRKAQAVPGISRTRAHNVITGRRDLDLDLLRGFLVVCDVSSEERLRWLGAFDRITRIAEPESLVTLPHVPATPPDRSTTPTAADLPPSYHHNAWPNLDTVRRQYPRKSKSAPDKVHRHLPWLLILAGGAPVCAILMTHHGIPVPTILGFLVMATLGVVLWTIHLPGIDTGRRHEKPYVRKFEILDDSDTFGVDRRAAPPVIGL